MDYEYARTPFRREHGNVVCETGIMPQNHPLFSVEPTTSYMYL